MNSLAVEVQEARAQRVSVHEDSLIVDMVDGRTILVPISGESQQSFKRWLEERLVLGTPS